MGLLLASGTALHLAEPGHGREDVVGAGFLARRACAGRPTAARDVGRDGLPRTLPLGAAGRIVDYPSPWAVVTPASADDVARRLPWRGGRAVYVFGRAWVTDPEGALERRPAAALRLVRQVRDPRDSHLLSRRDGDGVGRGREAADDRHRTDGARRERALLVVARGAGGSCGRRASTGRATSIRRTGCCRTSATRSTTRWWRSSTATIRTISVRRRETYPVGQAFPPYLPLTLVAHLPFGLVPQSEADALYRDGRARADGRARRRSRSAAPGVR